MPNPMELARNRLRPEESDEMRGTMPKMGRRRRGKRGGPVPQIGATPVRVDRPRGKIEKGPSSYGRLANVSEKQAERAVSRREAVANRGLSNRVEDLVQDPKFWDTLHLQQYENQVQADLPEILNGGAPESKQILDDALDQFEHVFGARPEW
jgi:hypothetical protein